MITIKELAKRAGVSRGTVDRVLNGRPGVKPETEARVRALMDQLGYHPDQTGRMLAARRKKLHLAFLVPHGPEFAFFLDILHAARDKAAELRELGVRVDFYLLRSLEPGAVERLLTEVSEAAPDGVATLPLSGHAFSAFLARMAERSVPVVFFNLDQPQSSRLCYVGCDYVRSGRVAAGLAALCAGDGGEVAVVACQGPTPPSHAQRLEGFSQEIRSRYPHLTLVHGGAPTVFHSGDSSGLEDLLARHPGLRALYLVNMGDLSVCRAARAAAGDRPVAIIANDLIPEQREMLRDGTLSATVSQQPEVQGSVPLQILYDLLVLGIRPSSQLHLTQLHIHISQNV